MKLGLSLLMFWIWVDGECWVFSWDHTYLNPVYGNVVHKLRDA